MSSHFDDIDAFFVARGVRRSPDGHWWMEDSYDFGVHWRAERQRFYRLTWIGPYRRWREEDSSCLFGELYLVDLGPNVTPGRHPVEFLCVVPPIDDGPGAGAPDGNVEKLLDGWSDVCGLPNSVDWVRDRAAEARLLWPQR